jgi:hypothetical protein
MEMFYALQNLSADTPNYRACAPLFTLRSLAPFFHSGLWRPFLPPDFDNFSSTNWTLAHILLPNSGAFSSSELSGTFICSLNWYLFCLLDSGTFSVSGLRRFFFLRKLIPFLSLDSGAFSSFGIQYGAFSPSYFFLCFYTAIFKPTVYFEPVFQPGSLSHGNGTEETPLVILKI